MPVQPPPPAPVYSSPAPSLFPASTSQTKQCAACGIAAPNMKFSPSCGAPTKASSPNAAVSSTATASRECTQCRATLAPNAKFCPSCGTSTARSSSRASPGKMASSSLSHMAKAAAARTYAAPTPQTTAAAVAAAPSVLAMASKFQANQPPVFQAGSSSALASVSSECSQCRATLAPKAKFCPSCGTSTAQMPPRTSQAKAAASASISDLTKSASKMTVAPTPQTTTMVVAGAPSALAMASNLHAAAPPAFFSSGSAAPPSRSTGQSTQQRPPFVPPTFVPPEHGTNHVYTMTQTVTRSVTYNA
ncbi:hypothetical protein LEN26_000480 [Aphanomyces euteiches]|nr:hypothetical protein AeMF1_000776 [Aphanomyces euteiches]KAH9163488.1 hypothetical protein LEN26_000480 [Aphanomyces euteiches]KAH9193315.1 hypothetical protein AeNC1_004715 [Aphanomyces euteiches]